MSSTLNGFTKIVTLGAIVAAAATPTAAAVVRPPDVSDAATRLTAPDVFERYAADHAYGKGISTPQSVGRSLYTPKMLQAHYKHEDILYPPRPTITAVSDTPAARGFDWSDWAIGLGSGIGLILALGGGLAIGRQRRQHVQTA
jgi:hypothetical protein